MGHPVVSLNRIVKYMGNNLLLLQNIQRKVRVVASLVRHSTDILETVKHQQSTLGYVASEVLADIRTWREVTERLLEILETVTQIKEGLTIL